MSCWFFYSKILFIGALTNKNIPYELRNWEIEKLINFDITNSFGYSLKLLVNSNQILAIEPNYSNSFLNLIFINNKSRYFFNNILYPNTKNSFYLILQIIRALCIILYMFELSRLKTKVINFFYIYYENISVDLLCLLSILRQKYSFILLYNILIKKFNNSLESGFLVNNLKFDNSNLCLLININIKLEATYLNLMLKQRNLKGNFKLISISSLFSTINNLRILGVNSKIIVLISEGLHPLCQTLKYERNPCILLNSQFLEYNNNKYINILLLYLNKFINQYKLNIINCSIHEPGIYLICNLLNNPKIGFTFSSIYLLNLITIESNFITNILNINLLYLRPLLYLKLKINRLYLTHDSLDSCNKLNIKYTSYFNLAIKTFYHNSHIFFNTQGLVKKSLKLFTNYKINSSWKIIRIIFSHLNNKIGLYTNLLINYNPKIKFIFIKFICLALLAKKPINNTNIINNINPFYINKKPIIYNHKLKFTNLRFKLWINDFYIGGKDDFTYSSLTMIRYSKISRLQLTNFL